MGGSGLGGGEVAGVDDDEDAFALGEELAGGEMEVDGVEELAAFAAEVAGGEGERGVERGGAEVIDLHVAGHGEEAEGAVELGHRFVAESGDDAAVDVAGWALVKFGEVNDGDGGGVGGVGGVESKREVEALGVVGAAAEAVGGDFVDGGSGEVGGGVRVHGFWIVSDERSAVSFESSALSGCGVEEIKNGGAVLVGFFGAYAFDATEVGEGGGAVEDEGAEGGGSEDKEVWEVEAVGFGGPPGSEALIEGLLGGAEGLLGLLSGEGGVRGIQGSLRCGFAWRSLWSR